ncbi:glycine betaine/proline transport system substrate-binding protein [Microbacterium sp. AK009]|uniref:glycine betaine ABC transporter substrate-binding protein n=1 Tax=Microbacterium sp. AK009 TaxID=2723068 RepID=UPI0015CAAE32|nr:glycine betaine ABC transporter substrate-binding protein [Microbacterium sp. AK009]NYF15456.1 glycine betaine/proline transport system substrate-binding protein [Microbacterium sp. AK009]
MNKKHLTGFLALGAAATLTLAGCAGGTDDAAPAAGGDASAENCDTVTLGFLPSWTDGLSTAYLLENLLGERGIDVEMETLTEAGPLYTGLAQGDVDIYPSAWPELTHASYMEEYGDDIEDLGAYYDNAKLTIAVPSYVDIDSIEDLEGNADRFGGRIVGIEPGAGLTAQTQDSMLPEYGLDGDYELVTSSTAAMLAELDAAIAAEEDIVVTLWRPFWANDAYDVKDLEDPMGAMGEAEALHFLGTAGFSERCAEAAELIGEIQLNDEQYGALEDLVVNEYGEGREAEAVEAWLEQYPDAVPSNS